MKKIRRGTLFMAHPLFLKNNYTKQALTDSFGITIDYMDKKQQNNFTVNCQEFPLIQFNNDDDICMTDEYDQCINCGPIQDIIGKADDVH
ncbi:unnamed protein product [Didymodactylos carnosus]|uniref:Uncharacterized protein n=1 Tax=Didymodactylos carnosus TaxID=1234261 RepID=A0A8S2IVN9_9BILA|nr:unnamed protein product [Didymodactylos carnosus]CAF3772069.1 unnamed protein product [Didymodactylos carnosus]